MDSLYFFDTLFGSLSPYINRFLSADTIVPGYANPQNLNRYSYVRNNPLRYTDPTGHAVDEGGGGGHCGLKCLQEQREAKKPGGGGHSLPKPTRSWNPPLYGDADLYSFGYSAGVGPWFGTVSIDIVINGEEAGGFLSYGVGPGFNGDELPGFNDLNDFDWTFFTPQYGAAVWRGVVSGEDIRNNIRAYEGTAFQAGGSAIVGLEYFSSVEPDVSLGDRMVDRQVEGLALGVTFSSPEVHGNYVDAIYLPEFSRAVNSVCQAIGCGRLE